VLGSVLYYEHAFSAEREGRSQVGKRRAVCVFAWFVCGGKFIALPPVAENAEIKAGT